MKETTNLQNVADQLNDGRTMELKTYISDAFTDLVETKVNMIIPEIVFKNHFLEFFYKFNHEQTNSTLALKWIELAGGAYNEVDVVDNNGHIIYTVPSLFTRPNVDDSILSKMSFSSIAHNFQAKLERTDAEGINYLNRELSSLPNTVSTESDNVVNRWLNIFQRYSTKQVAQPQLPTTLQDELDLNYD